MCYQKIVHVLFIVAYEGMDEQYITIRVKDITSTWLTLLLLFHMDSCIGPR